MAVKANMQKGKIVNKIQIDCKSIVNKNQWYYRITNIHVATVFYCYFALFGRWAASQRGDVLGNDVSFFDFRSQWLVNATH